MLGSKLLDAGNLPSGAFLANKDGLGRFRKDSALLNSDVSVGCINLAVRTARKLTGLSESEIMLYSRNENMANLMYFERGGTFKVLNSSMVCVYKGKMNASWNIII